MNNNKQTYNTKKRFKDERKHVSKEDIQVAILRYTEKCSILKIIKNIVALKMTIFIEMMMWLEKGSPCTLLMGNKYNDCYHEKVNNSKKNNLIIKVSHGPSIENQTKNVVQYTEEIPGFCAYHSQDMEVSLHIYQQTQLQIKYNECNNGS